MHPLTRNLVLAMNRKNGFLFPTNEIIRAWKQCFVQSSYHDGIKTIWSPNTKMRKDLVPAYVLSLLCGKLQGVQVQKCNLFEGDLET